jgi:hypothetical protein
MDAGYFFGEVVDILETTPPFTSDIQIYLHLIGNPAARQILFSKANAARPTYDQVYLQHPQLNAPLLLLSTTTDMEFVDELNRRYLRCYAKHQERAVKQSKSMYPPSHPYHQLSASYAERRPPPQDTTRCASNESSSPPPMLLPHLSHASSSFPPRDSPPFPK